MPLASDALTGRRDIAARLVQLLPANSRHVIPPAQAGGATAAAVPNWPPAMMIGCGIAVWLVLSMVLAFNPTADGAPPAERPLATHATTATAAVPPPDHAAAGAPAAPLVR